MPTGHLSMPSSKHEPSISNSTSASLDSMQPPAALLSCTVHAETSSCYWYRFFLVISVARFLSWNMFLIEPISE